MPSVDKDNQNVEQPEPSSLLVGVEIDTISLETAGQDYRKLESHLYPDAACVLLGVYPNVNECS